MTDSAARLLEMLALLGTGREHSGHRLAQRLEVSPRTIRRDIERLRGLGYPIEATHGADGGYRLAPAGKLPPLLLDEEEATAVALGVRTAGIAGMQDAGARALTKLQQVLPAHLRPTVDALHATVDSVPANAGMETQNPEVDLTSLRAIAAAIRAQEWLRFDYEGGSELVEPYRLLTWERRWYLVGRDPQEDRWRTYRVDWMTLRAPTRRGFDPHPIPGGDYTAFAMQTIAHSGWKVRVRLRINAPTHEVLGRIHHGFGVVEPIDANSCMLVTGADSLDTVAVRIGMLMMDFTVESPSELIRHLRSVGERYRRAVRGSSPSTDAGVLDNA